MNYLNKQEKCATCDYWCGNRQVDKFGKHVEVDQYERADCNNRKASNRSKSAANQECKAYEKWKVLK